MWADMTDQDDQFRDLIPQFDDISEEEDDLEDVKVVPLLPRATLQKQSVPWPPSSCSTSSSSQMCSPRETPREALSRALSSRCVTHHFSNAETWPSHYCQHWSLVGDPWENCDDLAMADLVEWCRDFLQLTVQPQHMLDFMLDALLDARQLAGEGRTSDATLSTLADTSECSKSDADLSTAVDLGSLRSLSQDNSSPCSTWRSLNSFGAYDLLDFVDAARAAARPVDDFGSASGKAREGSQFRCLAERNNCGFETVLPVVTLSESASIEQTIERLAASCAPSTGAVSMQSASLVRRQCNCPPMELADRDTYQSAAVLPLATLAECAPTEQTIERLVASCAPSTHRIQSEFLAYSVSPVRDQFKWSVGEG